MEQRQDDLGQLLLDQLLLQSCPYFFMFADLVHLLLQRCPDFLMFADLAQGMPNSPNTLHSPFVEFLQHLLLISSWQDGMEDHQHQLLHHNG